MATKTITPKNWPLTEFSGRVYSDNLSPNVPAISSVTGTVSNGNALTIAGSRLWDEVTTDYDPFFTTNTNASSFEGASGGADGYGSFPSAELSYDATVKLFGSKSLKMTAAGASGGGTLFDTANWSYTVDIAKVTQTYDDAWFRTYCRFDNNEWPSELYKFWWLGGSPYAAFLNIGVNGGAAPTQFMRTTTGDGAITGFDVLGGAALQNNVWYCVELHVRRDGAGGYVFQVWFDNVLVCNFNCSHGVSPNGAGWGFESNTNFGGTTAGFVGNQWQDGFVVKVGSSRVGPASLVEIGNSATYATATKVYQSPTTISDTSVVVTCNLTGLGAGPYWMWVTNSQGLRSAAKAL